MGIGYATAYRAGIIPWEKSGRIDRPTLDRLLDREEAARSDGVHRALDLGCGRGAHTKLLVDRGWDAIGVDDVRQAVDVAVRRATSRPVRARDWASSFVVFTRSQNVLGFLQIR